MSSRTDAYGTTSYEYNYQNQVAKMTDPLGNITTYTYGSNSLVPVFLCGDGGFSLNCYKGRLEQLQYLQ